MRRWLVDAGRCRRVIGDGDGAGVGGAGAEWGWLAVAVAVAGCVSSVFCLFLRASLGFVGLFSAAAVLGRGVRAAGEGAGRGAAERQAAPSEIRRDTQNKGRPGLSGRLAVRADMQSATRTTRRPSHSASIAVGALSPGDPLLCSAGRDPRCPADHWSRRRAGPGLGPSAAASPRTITRSAVCGRPFSPSRPSPGRPHIWLHAAISAVDIYRAAAKGDAGFLPAP